MKATHQDTYITNSSVYVSSGVTVNVSIGVATTLANLDVTGTVRLTGFQLATGADLNHVLTTDAFGLGTWQATQNDGD